MTVNELKNNLDFYIAHSRGDNVVVVELKEPSVGCYANTKVKGIYAGFDFDFNKLFIKCEDELRRHDKDRDVPVSAVKIIYTRYPETKPVIHCPNCENKLRKDDKYCSQCGQAITMNNLKVLRI